jgi:type VI secretion system secreted protein Hcp
MSVDLFLKLDGVSGESVDSKHKDEIDVLSWSWGVTQSGAAHLGSGGGAGKVSVSDLTITKYLDKSSPVLALGCCTGKHYKDALLTVRKAGDRSLEFLKFTLKDVIVTAYAPAGAIAESRPSEHVSLNFANFKIEYAPQNPDGSAGAAVVAEFNIAQNIKG